MCGHCEKANRRTQSDFSCQRCVYQSNADYNAANGCSQSTDGITPESVCHKGEYKPLTFAMVVLTENRRTGAECK